MLALALATLPQTNAADLPPAPPAPNDTKDTNATLLVSYKKMSLEELMNQEVTSVAKQPEPLGQAPAAIQVITGEDIRRSGATSLPEALRLADNLDVAQASSSAWNISARGFNSSPGNKLLVLMDGRSIYTPLFSGVIWNMQDYLLADIDRIEVISGPGGSLWGANAVNGVINITSKSANDTQGFYAEAGGGNWLESFAGIRYGGTLATNVYYRIYGKYFDQGAEVYADGSSAHDAWNRGQGGFRIDSDYASQTQFTLQGDIFGGDTDTMPAGEGTPTAEGTTSGGNVLGRLTHSYGNDADVSLQLYYDHNHVSAPFQDFPPFNVPAGSLYEDLDTYDVELENRFPLGQWNDVVWGLGYQFTQDNVQDAPLVAFVPGRLDQNLYSGFVQDEIELRDNVFFTIGSKLEHNDYTGFEFEPSARIKWNVTDRQMIWGAVSRAVRTPSRYDRDLFEPTPGYGSFLGTSNSTFRSETVIAYELGYRAQLGKSVSTSLSTYYNDYNHLRSLNFENGNTLPLVFDNGVEGHTYGGELSVDYQMLDWWRWHGGYNYLKEHIHVTPGQTDLYNALSETADPENQVFLRAAMDLPGRTELDAGFRWIDTLHVNNGGTGGTVPSYGELDARLAWHASKNIEISVVGQNLLQGQHPETGYPGSSQEEIIRSVFGKITWRF